MRGHGQKDGVGFLLPTFTAAAFFRGGCVLHFRGGRRKKEHVHTCDPATFFNTEDSNLWALLILFLSLGWFWGNGVIPYF
jgi:hypothetical protein